MKKKLVTIGLFVMLVSMSFAQSKQKQPSQKEVEKMMEDAMKAEGMIKEQVAEMQNAMKQIDKRNAEIKEAGVKVFNVGRDELKIPVKQIGLLKQIPVVQTQLQLNNYFSLLLVECKKNIPVATATQVDQLLASLNENENELAKLPVTLFLNRNIKAAVYAAIKVVQVKNNSPLIQNNSAFVLQQSGYPGKAVPVFKYLLQQYNTADFNNNLAQCYLSLGDKEEAKKYFRMGLAKNPNSSEMHCGLGLIFSEEGNIPEATAHIIESLKNSYSRVAEELAKKHHVKVKLSDIRVKPPEYFNPQKFKPAQPAGKLEDMPQVEAERVASEERFRAAQRKTEEFNKKYSPFNSETNITPILQLYDRYEGNTPFGRKASYMVNLINEERLNFLINILTNGGYKKKDDEYNKELEDGFKKVQQGSFGNDNMAAEQCVAYVDILNPYLQKTKANYEDFERNALPKIYDYTNQLLYWNAFLFSDTAYQSYFNSEVQGFYDVLNGFSQMQKLYPTPDWIYGNCNNYKEALVEIELEEMEAKLGCPINIKLPAAKLGSFKINCKSMELEGGELLKLGFERDMKTGEFSLAFGLGMDVNTGLLNAGAKGLMYFKFASDFSPIDMGLKGEAGIEAELFIFSVDEKLTGTMGVGSVNVDAVHLGKEINIFNVDATKD
ncbi:MAG: tetratricopeptide repeat protein [Ferruginibacter sp.]